MTLKISMPMSVCMVCVNSELYTNAVERNSAKQRRFNGISLPKNPIA